MSSQRPTRAGDGDAHWNQVLFEDEQQLRYLRAKLQEQQQRAALLSYSSATPPGSSGGGGGGEGESGNSHDHDDARTKRLHASVVAGLDSDSDGDSEGDAEHMQHVSEAASRARAERARVAAISSRPSLPRAHTVAATAATPRAARPYDWTQRVDRFLRSRHFRKLVAQHNSVVAERVVHRVRVVPFAQAFAQASKFGAAPHAASSAECPVFRITPGTTFDDLAEAYGNHTGIVGRDAGPDGLVGGDDDVGHVADESTKVEGGGILGDTAGLGADDAKFAALSFCSDSGAIWHHHANVRAALAAEGGTVVGTDHDADGEIAKVCDVFVYRSILLMRLFVSEC